MQLLHLLLTAGFILQPIATAADFLVHRLPEVEVVHHIEQRDAIQQCKAVLVALKASSFCSSFVPIGRKTATATRTGALQLTTATITPPTETVTSTTTITSAVPVRRGAAAPTCSIKGLPLLKPFACDVIRAACLLFVKPGVTTVCPYNHFPSFPTPRADWIP